MALTCEIKKMNVDNIFLLFENSGQYFKSYDEAYYNSRKPGMLKPVYYVFTPTMQKFKRVCEIEKCCRDYFNKVSGCDFYNIFTGEGSKQLKLIGEI